MTPNTWATALDAAVLALFMAVLTAGWVLGTTWIWRDKTVGTRPDSHH